MRVLAAPVPAPGRRMRLHIVTPRRPRYRLSREAWRRQQPRCQARIPRARTLTRRPHPAPWWLWWWSGPPFERTRQLVEVIVVVPGDQREQVVHRETTAGGVNGGPPPGVGAELAQEVERFLPASAEGGQRRVELVAQVLPL